MRREWMLLALRFLIGECPNSEYMPLQCVLTSEDLPKKYLHQKKSNGAYKLTLEGKRVLILGGTSGIGLAVAEAAKAEGSDVVVVSSKQSRVDSALTLLGGGAEGYVANLSDEKTIEALFGKMGPFDHLVYTAGDSVWQRLLGETKLEDAKSFFDVRFWGAFLVTKHGSKLIRPGGSIIFTSSTVPRRPSVGFAIGASISSAVEAFATAMAVELAPVRVNVVAPGIVRTPIWDRLPEEQREAFFAVRGAALPVGKVGEPAEVAEAYLCFMRSGYTTGQIVVVDGGMLLV
jgi:NAD(P)-dependent dehydrogenase (short-subunit alcohol dehydrogenase family)